MDTGRRKTLAVPHTPENFTKEKSMEKDTTPGKKAAAMKELCSSIRCKEKVSTLIKMAEHFVANSSKTNFMGRAFTHGLKEKTKNLRSTWENL